MTIKEFEKVEEKMWVRGKGYVCRITKVGSDWVSTDKKIFTMNYDGRYDYDFMSLGFENIESASHNIIEVLKVDDYANGLKITNVDYEVVCVGTEWVQDGEYYYDEWVDQSHEEDIELFADEIKHVVTKEQFESEGTIIE